MSTWFTKIMWQAFFNEDLSLVVRLMLLLGLIGALRIAFGVQDINNMVIMGIVYSYVALICVAGELQEIAGDAFHSAVCSCPWESWPVEERGCYAMLVASTLRPPQVRENTFGMALAGHDFAGVNQPCGKGNFFCSQVRFRYFGAMRLDTLSKIVNNLFKYVQVMRAGFSDNGWTE